jgi:hypothetical protein
MSPTGAAPPVGVPFWQPSRFSTLLGRYGIATRSASSDTVRAAPVSA